MESFLFHKNKNLQICSGVIIIKLTGILPVALCNDVV